MYSNKKMLLTGSSTTCIVIALLASNTITNLCFAQPLDANTTIVENSKHIELKENAKPHSPTKGIFYQHLQVWKKFYLT